MMHFRHIVSPHGKTSGL